MSSAALALSEVLFAGSSIFLFVVTAYANIEIEEGVVRGDLPFSERDSVAERAPLSADLTTVASISR
ncbi:MAG: hypothetical protein A3F17_04485 [Gammaproteobacteria bacterium RIFCSPHIGHO2_12_FULL_41_15]|nr:MAG: hypothetical protein A3F17_04485 [Gammaproteobacteria bacterium RIFCSPHIGHO2_12_FULL_41_15]